MDNLNNQFSEIYDKYIEKIYRFIFIKVNSRDTTEDLCSETFLHCWESLKKNKDKISNIQAFLYKIAHNLVIDYYRKKSKIKVVPANYEFVVDPNADLEKESFQNSDLKVVRTSLANLKGNYQDVIIRRYIEDLSISEIAEAENKSENAIRATLCRALKVLRKDIERKTS